jgi:hypothetical protein
VFETEAPTGFAGGTVLTFALIQGYPAEHNLGRLRLSVTTAKPPLPTPKRYGPHLSIVRGELAPSKADGNLVVTVEMKEGSEPVWLRNVGKLFSGEGKLGGDVALFEPVLGTATYPAPWQAWRIAVDATASRQTFELTIGSLVPPKVQMECNAYFIPDESMR